MIDFTYRTLGKTSLGYSQTQQRQEEEDGCEESHIDCCGGRHDIDHNDFETGGKGELDRKQI